LEQPAKPKAPAEPFRLPSAPAKGWPIVFIGKSLTERTPGMFYEPEDLLKDHPTKRPNRV
jgi:hypothetical protein